MLEGMDRLPEIMLDGPGFSFGSTETSLRKAASATRGSPFSRAFLIHDLSLSGSSQVSISPRIFATSLMLFPPQVSDPLGICFGAAVIVLYRFLALAGLFSNTSQSKILRTRTPGQ
jgi:hypothetical protein